jgi:hypothetical protein
MTPNQFHAHGYSPLTPWQKIAIGGTEAADGLKTRRYADLFLEASAHRCDLERSAAGNKSRS